MPRKGFTLIELILSIAIIGMIAVAVLPAFNTSIINIVRAGNRTRSVTIAEENISLVENPIPFQYDVTLPGGTIKGVNGTMVTGVATIEGSSGDEVGIFSYIPIK